MALTNRNLTTLPAGLHADSGVHGVRGLYLKVSPAGSRSWIGRTKIEGKTHKFGLGPLRETPLPLARDRWVRIRQRLFDGETPAQIRGKSDETHLFSYLAHAAYAARSARMKGSKKDQWLTSLESHMGALWHRPISELTTPVLMDHLAPLVRTKTETARKVVGRISIVFKQADALGITVPNPAPALRSALPWPKRSKDHHAAVDRADAPRVFQDILAKNTTASAILAVTILTGARAGTIRQLRPEWIKDGVIIAPPEAMKSDVAHHYPLTPVARAIVDHWASMGGDVVFPSRSGGPLSDMAILKLQKSIAPDTTVHGWRSVLTDYLRDEHHVGEDIIDATLAHSSRAARAAYARSTLSERRLLLLCKWEEFLQSTINL
ncbi:tyrosine-type recombinase/integrase [Shimia aestuarii]|nr:integrase family protein [Shimia aestuarii]